MIRILQLSDSIEKRNGRMSVIMNIYRRIDRTKVQFDFLVTDFGYENYSEEIRKLGGKIYLLPHEKQTFKNMKKLFNKVITDNKYSYIHYHAISKWGICLSYAHKLGLKVIVHSHATKLSDNFIKAIRNRLFSLNILYCSDERIAVSPEAGGKLFLWQNFKYIPNMVDYSKFVYNPQRRNLIRHQYNIKTNEKLIGMIGRLSKQKNQEFALKVFNRLRANNENVKLMIVGDYDHKIKDYSKKIENYIDSNNLTNSIIFTGFDDAKKYYSAFDVFWLPSLYEGMPTVGIEAQANGLPVLASCNITQSMRVMDNVNYLAIDEENIDLWVNVTKQALINGRESNTLQKFKCSSFDEEKIIKEWMRLYS